MFFCKFPRFSGYSRPSSSTIRSALWENAHCSLAALGVLLATAGGALLPTSVLFSAMASREPTSGGPELDHIFGPTQDVIMHVIPIAGCDPTSLCCVCFGLVVVVCFLFACFLVFLVWFFVWFLAGTAPWTAYRSTTSTFVAFDKLTALHVNYNSSVCRD